jgi:hypothetical protein
MAFDTTPEAAAIQVEIFRRKTPEERMRMAFEMSDSMRNLALLGLRSRHPELNENELKRELMGIMYGFKPEP